MLPTKPDTGTAHTPVIMDENGVLKNAAGKQVAAILPGEMREFGKIIVRAVNCHDELLAALRDIAKHWPDSAAAKSARAAIAKAEGRQP